MQRKWDKYSVWHRLGSGSAPKTSLPNDTYFKGHSCLRGGHRNLTNPWCSGPQGLPTTLNISTNMVLYPAIASSLCNLAISESSQNIVKNCSIRVSTKIQPHFLVQNLEKSQP